MTKPYAFTTYLKPGTLCVKCEKRPAQARWPMHPQIQGHPYCHPCIEVAHRQMWMAMDGGWS